MGPADPEQGPSLHGAVRHDEERAPRDRLCSKEIPAELARIALSRNPLLLRPHDEHCPARIEPEAPSIVALENTREPRQPVEGAHQRAVKALDIETHREVEQDPEWDIADHSRFERGQLQRSSHPSCVYPSRVRNHAIGGDCAGVARTGQSAASRPSGQASTNPERRRAESSRSHSAARLSRTRACPPR